jgi:hypothetical protein
VEQSETDSQLHAEIADLESAVVMLGDQLQSLRQQMTLKCDWNFTTYYITPIRWNESKFSWIK